MMFYTLHILELLVLLLSVAYLSFHYGKQNKQKHRDTIPNNEYLKGIQYLINNEQDKAVDLFIKLLEADKDIIETHFALGVLFRGRGEVDRAIRIHQSLIERSDLSDQFKDQAILELAKDYLAAGVLDRAERLFLQRIAYGSKDASNYRFLLAIYQQEKDWDRCIKVIEGSQLSLNKEDKANRAQYYCEWVLQNLHVESKDKLSSALKKAKQLDPSLLRINMIKAELAILEHRYLDALKEYHTLLSSSALYLNLIKASIEYCFKNLDDNHDIIDYYQSILSNQPIYKDYLLVELACQIQKYFNTNAAISFIKNNLQQTSSLMLMQTLVSLYESQVQGDLKQELKVLSETLDKSIQTHQRYQCSHCGFLATTFFWDCPGCHQWSTIQYEK